MGFELENSEPQIHGCEKANLQKSQQQELAALERSLKDLPPPSSSSTSTSSSSSASSSSSDLEAYAEDCSRLSSDQAAIEQVDSFLKDALNSRNRITVLRLEHEIEKFVRNSKQQHLLRPMPSSYERLAAHRVAQHYHLQSMVVDANSPAGSRILLLKTPESKTPVVRLVDIPLDPCCQEKSTCAPLEKVAIKQRANAGNMNGYGNAGDSGKLTPVKSVEERKEEYNKARARIFRNLDPSSMEGNDDSVPDVVDVEVGSVTHQIQELVIDGGLASNAEGRDKPEDDYSLKNASRVAIFRDREKDMKDPDYDRSYDRYSQRLTMDFGFHGGPFVMQGACYPGINMNGFTRMDGSLLQNMRHEPATYPNPHHPRGPWLGSPAGPVIYPNGFYGSFPHIPANFQSTADSYFPTQRFPYTAHHYVDRCQFPSQPGLHCKTNFSEIMPQR